MSHMRTTSRFRTIQINLPIAHPCMMGLLVFAKPTGQITTPDRADAQRESHNQLT
jgi:hypothetical protein